MIRFLSALILTLFALASTSQAQDAFKPDPGYRSLFNGKDLTGWVYKGSKDKLEGKTETSDKRFHVKDGAIVCDLGKGIKDLYTAETFEQDFVVKMEYRAGLKADSGVYVRGPQLQIRDFARRGEQKQLKNFKNDDWNLLVITVKGTESTATLNGEAITPAKMKVPAKGGVGLQAESGKFEYRNIQIMVTADKEKEKADAAPVQPRIDSFVVAQASGETKKRVLLITESKGFVHSVVRRSVTVAKDAKAEDFPKLDQLEVKENKGKVSVAYHGRLVKPLEIKAGDKLLAVIKPCLVETTFMDLAAKSGLFDVVCSQNSRVEISDEALKTYDAVFFYTTGELPLSEAQKSDLLSFIRKGKGFGGSHCATDTFYKWKEYGELIGGYFDGHPWHQKIRVIVEDKKHAATKHLGDSFEITDEIYQFRTPYSREKLKVLMRMDMDSVKNPGKRADKDNALAWVHQFGKGNVFYTALGHREEVWADPRFQQHVIGGLRFMFGMEK